MIAFLKFLSACGLMWLGVYLGVLGMLTTALALSVILLVISAAALIGGAALAANMLQRESDIWIRLGFVLLIIVGTWVVLYNVNASNWFKGF